MPETKAEIMARLTQANPALAPDIAMAEIFIASGFFKNVQSLSQAIVKVMAGRELGIGAFAAMSSLHLVEGKVFIGYDLIAAAISKDRDARYEITKHDRETCVVSCFRKLDGKWELLGESSFTMDDARRAGLVRQGSPWEKYPRNMLFARAISNAHAWFYPDAFGGQRVYELDEMREVAGMVAEERPIAAEEQMPQSLQEKLSAMRQQLGLAGSDPGGAAPLTKEPLAGQATAGLSQPAAPPGPLDTAKTLFDAVKTDKAEIQGDDDDDWEEIK